MSGAWTSPRFLAVILAIVLPLGVLIFTTRVRATSNVITVNTLTDESATEGQCSLREAITNANAGSQVSSDCAAGTQNDTIQFSTGLTGTITLTSALPAIQHTLVIDGSGTGVSIIVSGADTYLPFLVNASANLTLNDLTIAHSHGSDGGGAQNNGTLTVTNCTFTANHSNV